MTGPYVRLRQLGSGLAVYVNAANVTHVAEVESGGGCQVHLVGGEMIHTDESAGDVVDMIDSLVLADSARTRPDQLPTPDERLAQQSGPFRLQT